MEEGVHRLVYIITEEETGKHFRDGCLLYADGGCPSCAVGVHDLYGACRGQGQRGGLPFPPHFCEFPCMLGLCLGVAVFCLARWVLLKDPGKQGRHH